MFALRRKWARIQETQVPFPEKRIKMPAYVSFLLDS
jgi:hypothetical protein